MLHRWIIFFSRFRYVFLSLATPEQWRFESAFETDNAASLDTLEEKEKRCCAKDPSPGLGHHCKWSIALNGNVWPWLTGLEFSAIVYYLRSHWTVPMKEFALAQCELSNRFNASREGTCFKVSYLFAMGRSHVRHMTDGGDDHTFAAINKYG